MNRVSVVIGVAAAAALAAIYAVVVGAVGGPAHLVRQTAADWPWLVLILAGFGAQAAAYTELRRRRRLTATVRGAAGAGGGASTVGMVACCAHHAADLAPLIGVSGLTVFLTEYRIPIMLVGIVVNAIGVTVAVRRLRQSPAPIRQPVVVGE